jgi:hypothetical protein
LVEAEYVWLVVVWLRPKRLVDMTDNKLMVLIGVSLAAVYLMYQGGGAATGTLNGGGLRAGQQNVLEVSEGGSVVSNTTCYICLTASQRRRQLVETRPNSKRKYEVPAEGCVPCAEGAQRQLPDTSKDRLYHGLKAYDGSVSAISPAPPPPPFPNPNPNG